MLTNEALEDRHSAVELLDSSSWQICNDCWVADMEIQNIAWISVWISTSHARCGSWTFWHISTYTNRTQPFWLGPYLPLTTSVQSDHRIGGHVDLPLPQAASAQAGAMWQGATHEDAGPSHCLRAAEVSGNCWVSWICFYGICGVRSQRNHGSLEQHRRNQEFCARLLASVPCQSWGKYWNTWRSQACPDNFLSTCIQTKTIHTSKKT